MVLTFNFLILIVLVWLLIYVHLSMYIRAIVTYVHNYILCDQMLHCRMVILHYIFQLNVGLLS